MAKDFHHNFIEVFNIEPNEELLKAKSINFNLLDFLSCRVKIYYNVRQHFNKFLIS